MGGLDYNPFALEFICYLLNQLFLIRLSFFDILQVFLVQTPDFRPSHLELSFEPE